MKKNNLGVRVYSAKPVFADKRGKIFDFVEDPVSHVGMVTFAPGAERGHHYHKKSIQYTYVISGKLMLTVSDTAGKHMRRYALKTGSVSIIPRSVVHTYRALTPAVMLDLTTGNRKRDGYEKDTFRVSFA